DPKVVLNSSYVEVRKRQPTYVDVYLAIGDLAFEKGDYLMAGDAYQQAVKLDPLEPAAHFGLARAFAPSDSERAEAAIKAALERNPNHVDSLLLIADEQIDGEQYEAAEQTLAKVAAVNPSHPRAGAYKAILAHLRNQLDKEKAFRAAALKPWPTNPEVDYLIGKKLSQKYRFAEGEQYQRQALKFDPNFLPAKSQLATDLLRLGREEEGWKLAGEVYDADGYNVNAHNLVTLQENIAKFRTLEEDGLMLRMDAREADIYGRRVLDLLKRAKKGLSAKYAVQLPQPIVVEMFPQQQDFAIRTFGMPGGAGFLGVCFGTVITANSPASQGASPSCWEATLWHEFCHVVTLNKTKNKMPRWLSEGISVYEERQADKTWGQTITPQYRAMLLGDDLVPVSQLSSAFLSPETPLHLQFAYFESSLVVEFLVEKYGLATLQRVLVDLSVGMPINESLARYAGSLEALDKDFAAYARKHAEAMAKEADWTEPELPRRASAELISTWLKDHPNNYTALLRLAQQQVKEQKWEAARGTAEKLKQLYPNDESAAGPYALLAGIYRELGKTQEERAALERLAELSDDDGEMFARLVELTQRAGDHKATKKYALRWLAVNPLIPAPHRAAAAAAEGLGEPALAVDCYRALLLLDPIDPAELHLKLARALSTSGDLKAAKRHALLALEETPRYRPAHKLLLEIAAKLPAETPPIKPATPPAPTTP
ncbi:MAG TPA: tetratricopeptide repeat protein, partial [Pirellulaceae bacterium]|nr:tetratricopeptide repeat protein [Pirellulaceae bacterium]